MPPKIKFELDKPQVLAFCHDRGKPAESRFPGAETQFFRNVEGMKCAYLAPSLEDILVNHLHYRAGELVSICKRKTAAGAFYWEVDFANVRPDPPPPAPAHREPTRPLPRARSVEFPENKYFTPRAAPIELPEVAPSTPASSAAHVNGAPINRETAPRGVMATTLEQCLCAAIDAAREAQVYATNNGFPLTFSADQVQDLASTLYIHQSKQSNIALMHRNEELRSAARVSR